MLQHATGHHTDRSLFHKRFKDFPQCHRHPCPSFTGSLLLARGTKLPKNSSTLEGLGVRACLTDRSRNFHSSRSVLELEIETRLAIVVILTLGSHRGFRVPGTGQVHGRDELPPPTQRQFHPVPADLQIALAPKPMRVDPE